MKNNTSEQKSIVLLSGGMDSLVTAAIAVKESQSVCFLHFDYGQRTASKEYECFIKITEFYKPLIHKVVQLSWLGALGGSSLTDNRMTIEINTKPGSIPLTYVPFRNAIFISAAVAWAEVIRADRIYLGAVEEDSSGYPDTTEAFIKAMQTVINTGTKKDFQISLQTPVIHMKKSEIVKLGVSLNVPFEYSWSCYQNISSPCKVCDSCKLRSRAFREAGVMDPIDWDEEK